MELVIASKNSQKVLLLKGLIKELLPEVEVLSLFDFSNYEPPVPLPTGSKSELALFKAKHAAEHIQLCCIAEEWQMTIPAIQAELESIFTSTHSIAKKCREILQVLKGKKEYERTAFLESFVAYAFPNNTSFSASASLEGVITETECGQGSLDFDSIFIKYGYAKTLAELTPSVRSRISHRRKALDKLILSLESRLSSCTT